MFNFVRRENGITIRYLAQCLINDLVFKNQEGIIALINKCCDGNGNRIIFDYAGKWEYWFLFHLEDFGSGDKSEIDILLRNGNTLFPIEVKAFTDPNASDVKREIIRNYLTLNNFIERQNPYFQRITSIYPILIYSLPVYEHKNPSSKDFNYLNNEYLFKKGFQHKNIMDVWGSNAVKNHQLEDNPNALSIVKEISKRLLFVNWDNILEIISSLNKNGLFDNIIDEMINRKDSIQNIRLVKTHTKSKQK